MAVKIVTDSTSDLTPEIAGELGITVVPLYVHFGPEVYRDGIDLTTQDFYRKLAQNIRLARSSRVVLTMRPHRISARLRVTR